jgi:hypothetical protein
LKLKCRLKIARIARASAFGRNAAFGSGWCVSGAHSDYAERGFSTG